MVERLVDSIGHGGVGSPPLIEVNPPFLENENPSPLESGVEIERNIFFRVTDAPDDPTSGVDISTLVVLIQQDGGGFVTAISGGVFQGGFTGTITDVFADGFSFDVNIDPSAFLQDGIQVDVRVQVQDTTIVGTQLDTTYDFDTEVAEANPPVISNEDPFSGETGVSAGTNVAFRLTDVADQVDSGVDTSTLDVEIENGVGGGFVFAIVGGVFQAGFSGTIVDLGGGLSYGVDINPDVDFLQLDTSRVRVNVDDTKASPNHLSVTYSFDVAQTDAAPPFVDNRVPSSGQGSVAEDASISFRIHDLDSGVDLTSLDVIVDVNGSPATAILAGVFQAGFSGLATPIGDGYAVTIAPDTDFGPSATVTVTIDVQDLASPSPNVMSTVLYSFFTSFPQPVCVLAQRKIVSLLGSIIQLDGRDSSSPDGAAVTFEWRFRLVPSGSVLEPDLDVVNPSSMSDLRPSTWPAISFIPDMLGRYVVELTVSNGGNSSTCTALIEIGLSRALCGEGVVPDVQFLWGFLSNFWNLVEDREQIQILWSAIVQVLGSEYVKLWSNDYNKSLETIQATVQRRWQLYKMHTDLFDQVQRVIVGNTTSGALADTGEIGAPPAGADTSIIYTDLGNDDFTAIDINYGAKGRIIEINGDSATIERVYNLDIDSDSVLDTTVIVTDEEVFPDGQVGVDYRIPHLLHVPLVDLEEAGVRIGDVLVLVVRRGDTGATAEIRTQVVASDRTRIGFEFTLADLSPGDPTIDHALFRQLVQDLGLVSPAASDTEIAQVAEAFISMVPTGINLTAQPFSTFQITIKAKKVIHNTAKKVDDLLVSIPFLQSGTDLKDNPSVIYRENTDYLLIDGNIVFQNDTFSRTSPAPEELWAECVHVDNAPKIESNFGRLVGLRQDDVGASITRAPYIGAVRGLWFALTSGTTIDNIRLGIQILMGLPFSEARGRIINITNNFSKDTSGNDIGRILLEDVDDNDRLLGRRRFAFFPELVGIEDNPLTGSPLVVGDIVEQFFPLSKGVVVTDYVREPLWWTQTLKSQEIKKFFIFKAELDTATGIFNEEDLIFSLEFVRRIKPIYTQVVAAVVKNLDDDILTGFVDSLEGTSILMHFYDNVGAYGGLESTVRSDDYNHLGFVLWRGDSMPFSTRSLAKLRDVVTAANGAAVEATSVVGFGQYRIRALGDLSHPTVEGDILAIERGQPGGGPAEPGLYEITAGTLPNGPLTLGNELSAGDPLTWDVNAPDSGTFEFATGLAAVIVRRFLNPVVQGTNLETTKPGAIQLAESIGELFITHGVQIDDHLVIESGVNAWPTRPGEYRIVNINTIGNPRDFAAGDFPQISETQVGLINLDFSAIALVDTSGQEFRIVKSHLMRNRVTRAKIVQSGGDMFAEVLDFDGGTAIPFDVFTPGMVGGGLNVSLADNPLNDGDYTILAYDHAGRVRITTGSPQTSDVDATAVLIITSRYHPGFERADELAPAEAFEAVVT